MAFLRNKDDTSMSERAIFYSAFYRTRCSFASINQFFERVDPHFDSREGGVESTCQAVDRAIAQSFTHGGPVTSDAEALRILLGEDLRRIKEKIRPIQDESTSTSNFSALLDRLVLLLHEIGIHAEVPYFTIVDKFPKPFDSFTWSAMCPDKSDEKKFGIKPGIYLLKSRLRPYYSQVLVSHELIHAIVGRRDPHLLAMGLEEGLAEVLGSLYLGSNVFNHDIARNVFVYGRYNYRGKLMWDLYLDHARQAALIYRRFGMPGIVSLINEGRKAIHHAEACLLGGSIDKLDLSPVDVVTREPFSKLLDEVLDSLVPRLIVSPLAAHLLRYVDEGATLDEICEQAQVPAKIGRECLEATGKATTLYVVDDDRVSYSNVKFYREIEERCETSVIRYWITQNGDVS